MQHLSHYHGDHAGNWKGAEGQFAFEEQYLTEGPRCIPPIGSTYCNRGNQPWFQEDCAVPRDSRQDCLVCERRLTVSGACSGIQALVNVSCSWSGMFGSSSLVITTQRLACSSFLGEHLMIYDSFLSFSCNNKSVFEGGPGTWRPFIYKHLGS